MARALYLVIHSQGRWWVDFEGRAHGPHSSKEAAAEEGRELARMATHAGRRSEVLMPDDFGRYRVVWSSAHEPHARSDYALRRASTAA